MKLLAPKTFIQALLGFTLVPTLLLPQSVQARQRELQHQCNNSFKIVSQPTVQVFSQPERDAAGRRNLDAQLVGTLAERTTVLVVLADRSGNFVEVETPQKIRGWVPLTALASGVRTVMQFNGFLEVKDVANSRVMLRSGPSRQSPIIARLDPGTLVRHRSDEGEWVSVTDAQGRSGYMAGSYLVCTLNRF
jgi:SH3-like domain-containing protein